MNFLLKKGGRISLLGGYALPARLREVRLYAQEPQDVCIEELRVGSSSVLRGAIPADVLPTTHNVKGSRSLYLSVGVPQGRDVRVALRSLGNLAQGQTVKCEIRLESPDGTQVMLTLEKET